MEARRTLPHRLMFLVTMLFVGQLATTAAFANRSENFIVSCSDREFGQRVANEAERFRRELAIEWLGRELPPWEEKIPIRVVFAQYASGLTRFRFMPSHTGKGRPFDWEMVVEGPRDRILDAVLPHEITHAIFASHFGRQLPRWADEGACTTVEHEGERKKHRVMLVEFLMTRRGIPFNRMFPMMEYPRDMLPLYAQGHSVADFLIQHHGKQAFVKFIEAGLDSHHDWDRVTREFYDYEDLSDLQVTWNEWVRLGSQPLNGRQPDFRQSIVAQGDAESMSGGASLAAVGNQANGYGQPQPGRGQVQDRVGPTSPPIPRPATSLVGATTPLSRVDARGDYQVTPNNFNATLSNATRTNVAQGSPTPSYGPEVVSGESWYFAVKREFESGQNVEFTSAPIPTAELLQREITYRAELETLELSSEGSEWIIMPGPASQQRAPIYYDSPPPAPGPIHTTDSIWR